ncbi:MAG: hypothetical protein ACYC4L_02710 [Chloroflexota bacterium]
MPKERAKTRRTPLTKQDSDREAVEQAEEVVRRATTQSDALLEEDARRLAQLPASTLTAALRLIARDDATQAVTMLTRLASGAAEAVAVAAAECLGDVRTVQAAAALHDLAESATSKAVRKASRRSLHRLQTTGISAATELPDAPPTQQRDVMISRVSNPDGLGERLMVLAVAAPLGSADFVTSIVSDLMGLRDCRGARFSRAELPRRVSALLRDTEGLHLVDAPPAYLRQALAEALDLNRAGGHAVPDEYYRWAGLLAQGERVYEHEPVYELVNAALVRWSPQLAEESAELLHLPEFAGWLMPPTQVEEAMRAYAKSRERRLVLLGDRPDQGQNTVVDQLADGFFTEANRRLYKRRLEQSAYVLQVAGRTLQARMALAAALALDTPRTPASRVPFAREMALHTAQSLQHESERQRLRGGGLILP